MSQKDNQLKTAYLEYLSAQALHALRPLGREVGVLHSTQKLKDELVQEIAAVLCGEMQPSAQSGYGAPVKNNHVDPLIYKKLEDIRSAYSSEVKKTDYSDLINEKVEIIVHAKEEIQQEENAYDKTVYAGMLERDGASFVLLHLNGRTKTPIVWVSEELLKPFSVRLGDVVSCYADTIENKLVATRVLTVNGRYELKSERPNFEEEDVVYSSEKISFSDKKSENAALKYIDWLAPVVQGQRGVIRLSASGKSRELLFDMIYGARRLNPSLTVMGLLVDGTPETAMEFRRSLWVDRLVVTTYDDDADLQVFAAKSLLKRVKRSVEMGLNVLLFVDSLTALAKAYDETVVDGEGKVLPCGLNSKSVHFVKKFLGSGRAFASVGSLTVIGLLEADTDEYLVQELSKAANWSFVFDGELSQKRIAVPADFVGSGSSRSEEFCDSDLLRLARETLDLKRGNEKLSTLIHKSKTPESLKSALETVLKK